jgi:hypothetical protein
MKLLNDIENMFFVSDIIDNTLMTALLSLGVGLIGHLIQLSQMNLSIPSPFLAGLEQLLSYICIGLTTGCAIVLLLSLISLTALFTRKALRALFRHETTEIH